MRRPARWKFSRNLPPLPISPSELGDIYRAILRYPITGDPVIDFRLVVLTGMLESGYKSPTIMPPNNESSALGYFQIISSVRRNIAKRIGVPWDNSMYTQALFSAYGYRELANMLRRGRIPMFRFLPDPMSNFVANIRFRYVVGTGSRYFGHRDAKSFLRKLMSGYNFLAQGDSKTMKYIKTKLSLGTKPVHVCFMHPKLVKEFSGLPKSVRETFLTIVSSFTDANCFVSSICSSFNGRPRTIENGPNHREHKAIDFVITPFRTPFFIDQEGKKRSPQFHWNQYLKDHLVNLFDSGQISASVLIEPDHIHIDSNHEPGISVKHGDKAIYDNLNSCGLRPSGISIIRIRPLKQ